MRPFWRHLFHCHTFSAQIVSVPIRCSLTVHLFRVRFSKKHRILALKRSTPKSRGPILQDSRSGVPNLLLTMAQINFENFPWPIFQSVTELQFSNILRSVCDLKKKKGQCTRKRNFLCVFKRSKKTIFAQDTASFCKFCEDFRKKGGNRENTTFLNQISNFRNGSAAHRKMLLWPTGWKHCSRWSLHKCNESNVRSQ